MWLGCGDVQVANDSRTILVRALFALCREIEPHFLTLCVSLVVDAGNVSEWELAVIEVSQTGEAFRDAGWS